MQKNTSGIALGVLVCLVALTPTSAYAYLDPGTGTFALQGLVAGIAGGLMAIRAYWGKIAELFRRSKVSSKIYPERSIPNGDA
jgi:hypothetical protein